LGLGSGAAGRLLRQVVEAGAKALDLERCRIFATAEAMDLVRAGPVEKTWRGPQFLDVIF
jgi:hypothetical protein